jgi:Trk-type K+ transport system membrane component
MIASIPIFVILESHLEQQNWFASMFHVVSASTTTGF